MRKSSASCLLLCFCRINMCLFLTNNRTINSNVATKQNIASENRKKITNETKNKNQIRISPCFIQAVLLESSIVLLSGLLNKFVPSRDPKTSEPINLWLKYIDPSLTLLIVIVIAIKAVPVIWSLGHILVEAVPSGINTHQLIQTIMKTIPQIRAVHSVHVWRYEEN